MRAQRPGSSKPVTFDLVCKSTTKELAKVEKFLNAIAKKVRLDDGATYRLLVAATESVNNAILHGNKLDESKLVRIRCTVNARALRLKIMDEGEGFDPSALENPLEEKNLLKDHGRGVFLMRALMDNVKIKRTAKGSYVELTLKLV